VSLLEIDNLSVRFKSRAATIEAVRSFDLRLEAGETLGLVGESGSGKSVAMLALLGLIDPPGDVVAHGIRFDGIDLLNARPAERRRIIGKDIAMIFQDPVMSLNPVHRVGEQIVESLSIHARASRAAMRARAVELLASVGIPEAGARFYAYPHQLSGGMCQRVMIAMAISCAPRLLIADEPTTALDVTVQDEIMELLSQLQARHHMAMILISHNLAVVSRMAGRVAVMYAGEIVESAPAREIFRQPRHPYSAALLAAIPERTPVGQPLYSLPGVAPRRTPEAGGQCLLAERCPKTTERCRAEHPDLTETFQGTQIRCFAPLHPEEAQ
jgi:dipeptide transport system ATP-binding protein